MTEFHAPEEGTREEDQKAIDNSQSSGRIDWDARKWKPQDGEENLVRILPAIGKAKYHLGMAVCLGVAPADDVEEGPADDVEEAAPAGGVE